MLRRAGGGDDGGGRIKPRQRDGPTVHDDSGAGQHGGGQAGQAGLAEEPDGAGARRGDHHRQGPHGGECVAEEVAKSEGVKLPADTDAKHKAAYAKLSGLSGAAFDKAYIANQVNDHDNTVNLINHEEESTHNAPLMKFLDVTFPKIKMHTKMLHQIKAGMTAV